MRYTGAAIRSTCRSRPCSITETINQIGVSLSVSSVVVVLVAIVVVLHVQMSRVQRLETDRDPGAHVGVNSIFTSIVLVST